MDAPPGMFTRALRLACQDRPARLRIETFRGSDPGTSSFLVYDEASRIGVVIDPAVGDAGDGAPGADLVDAIERLSIDLHFSLETQPADGRPSSSPWLARRFGALVVASHEARPEAGPHGFPGGDVCAQAGDEFRAGPLRIEVLPPGDRGDGVRYRIGDTIFASSRARPRLVTRRVGQVRRLDPDPAAAA